MKKPAKAPVAVPASEETSVLRKILVWLNTYPSLPAGALRYWQLISGVTSMALYLETAAYKVREYISGGYQAQMRLNVIYRIQPGDSGSARLTACEALNLLSDWATERTNYPVLGEDIVLQKIATESRAALLNEWEDGDEDYGTTLILTYEVTKNDGFYV